MKPTLPEPTINTASHAHTRVIGYTPDTVQRLIDEAYEAGIEDAAKACDDEAASSGSNGRKDASALNCASAIRALQGK